MTTITLPRAVVEQALEALAAMTTARCGGDDGMDISPINAAYDKAESAITALRAALAKQAEPVEPVYWEVRCTAHPKWMRVDEQQFDEYVSYGWEGQRLYTAPPQQAEPVDTDCHTQGICQRSGYGIGKQADPQIEDRLARHGIPKP